MWWQHLLERFDQLPVIGEWSIGNWLNNLLSSLFRAGAGSGVGWLLPVLLAILLTLILWVIVKQLYLSRPAGEEESPSTAEESKALQWWERGEAHALRGEYREGIRCLFRHALETLDHREALDRRDHKTNREYREEVAVAAPIYLPVFQLLVLRFELVWYGMIEPEASDYEEYRRLCEGLTGGGTIEAG